MQAQDILDIFNRTGALLTGHFRLTSGLHSNRYFQAAKVLQYPELAEKLCRAMIKPFSSLDASTVIAPAVGGIIAGHEAAHALGTRAIFSERQGGEMTLRRGFEIEKGERLVIVEDVTTTGDSVREVIELVKREGAVPVGVGCIVDRSGGQIDFGIPFHPLIRIEVATFQPDNCDLCHQGIPTVKPGSRDLH